MVPGTVRCPSSAVSVAPAPLLVLVMLAATALTVDGALHEHPEWSTRAVVLVGLSLVAVVALVALPVRMAAGGRTVTLTYVARRRVIALDDIAVFVTGGGIGPAWLRLRDGRRVWLGIRRELPLFAEHVRRLEPAVTVAS